MVAFSRTAPRLTPRPGVHIVRHMNNSTGEHITPETASAAPAETPSSPISDALIDELEDSMTRMGRLMAMRHGGHDTCAGELNPVQAMLMRALLANKALKMADIAALLAIRPPAASAVVDALEHRGFVTRTPSDDDRRVTLVCLTPAGCTVLTETEEARRAQLRRYMQLISEDDVRTLLRIQNTLIDAIESGRV
jgi:DNA-binding MarR family transcriptional regulator